MLCIEMSIAFNNGHSRQGAISADIVSARSVTTDTLQTGVLASNMAEYDTLTVNMSTTLSGTVAFGSAPTFSGTSTFSGAATFQDNVTVAAGHVVTLGSPTTFSAGATVSPGQTLAMSGVTMSGGPTFSGGATVSSGQTLALSGASVSGTPTFTGGLTVSSGQTLALAGVSVSGNPTFTGSPVLSPGQTLTFTGATLAGGSTGAITNLATVNGVPTTVATFTGYGGPVRATIAFPRLTLPASGTGIYVIDNGTFTGQAGNGTDPGTVRGGPVATTAARIGEIDAFGPGLINFWVFNRSPYTLVLGAPGITGTDEQSTSANVWWPMTMAHFSRATVPTAGDYTGWRAETQPLSFVSGWASPSTSIPTSSDCTIGAFRHHYGVEACKPSGDPLGARVWGQVLLNFTTAAPTDPVRITLPLPVGPQATTYPNATEFVPRVNFFRDWVVSSTGMFPENLPAFVGDGELGRDLTTYARTDATARVAAYVEDGDANVGFLRIVISGFTGGAGTYKLRCNYEVPLDNIQYRATFPTFTNV